MKGAFYPLSHYIALFNIKEFRILTKQRVFTRRMILIIHINYLPIKCLFVMESQCVFKTGSELLIINEMNGKAVNYNSILIIKSFCLHILDVL